jgi:hypothetical protein
MRPDTASGGNQEVEIVARTSRGRAREILRFVVCLLFAAAASEVRGSGAVPGAMRSCEELPEVVKLRLVLHEVPLSEEIERRTRNEVESIWEPTGIDIEWVDTEEAQRTPVIYVVMRRDTKSPSTKARVAGWIRFRPDGLPSNLIEVSYPTVLRKLQNARHLGGWRYDESTREAQDVLMGRAIGRVVAHELGHWLLGRGHSLGLMKPNFSSEDLIHPRRPIAEGLPRGCRVATLARRETLD